MQSLISCCCSNFLRVSKKEITKPHQVTTEQKLVIETKFKSLKFSKNLKEIKENLQKNFNLYLEGHTSGVCTVAVTSDNKYIISGSGNSYSKSYDNTIRIWSLLTKTQKAVLEGHTNAVTTIAVTTNILFLGLLITR